MSFGSVGSAGPLGRVEPRLWTPPLRELTPDTSYGYDVAEFAESIGRPLDPWQRWCVIHLGELLPDGRPRFRKCLILVARQNGKTELLVILTLFWLFIDRIGLVLGTSTKLDYARESWLKAVSLAKRSVYAEEIESIRRTNGEQSLEIKPSPDAPEGCRYKIAASNAEGGRSLSIGRLVMDELRQQYTYEAWDAMTPATNAIWDAQIVAITNQGSDRSIVLNDLRADALSYIETGQGDERLGLLEWSSPPEAVPDDLDALAMANPNLGYRIDPDVLLADARAAIAAGGEKLSGFRVEILCQRVSSMDAAINPERWRAAADPKVVELVRAGCALGVDVSPDFRHVSLVAAAVLPDGRIGLRVAGAWSGDDATKAFRTALPGLLRAIRPRVIGWLPQGPSATLVADLRRFITTTAGDKPVKRLHGVRVEEIRAEVAGVCMSLSEQVDVGGVVHPDDPLLTQHALAAERKPMGDGWRFTRAVEENASPVDCAYAAAIAAHLARTTPSGLGQVRIVTPRQG